MAACVWDYAEGMTLLRRFWDAALAIDPDGAAARDEGRVMPYCGPGELAALWAGAGLRDVAEHTLEASAHYPGFDALWEPFPLGVAPSGAYVAALAPERSDALREALRARSRRPARRVHAARAGVVRDRAAPARLGELGLLGQVEAAGLGGAAGQAGTRQAELARRRGRPRWAAPGARACRCRSAVVGPEDLLLGLAGEQRQELRRSRSSRA